MTATCASFLVSGSLGMRPMRPDLTDSRAESHHESHHSDGSLTLDGRSYSLPREIELRALELAQLVAHAEGA